MKGAMLREYECEWKDREATSRRELVQLATHRVFKNSLCLVLPRVCEARAFPAWLRLEG